MNEPYPFTAVVGQEPVKTALLMLAVDPSLGGVLIRGQKGTAKSTMARALAALLPPITVIEGSPYRRSPDEPPVDGEDPQGSAVEIPTPLVELPIGATEDRLIGSLQVEAALKSGERRFEPGLLAAAHRGVLYVDEVNLLQDHLVDVLLDVAASGVNRVEREGISTTHPACFMLIGTMNPEEGELRPQFLDRFGLCVTVRTQDSVDERREIARRRLAYEDDASAFIEAWREAEMLLRSQVQQARTSRGEITVPDAMWEAAARLAHAGGVHGHRAEIGIIKAARALATFLGRETVDRETLAEGARYVLPHRLPADPLASAVEVDKRIDRLIGEHLYDRGTEVAEQGSDDAVDLDDPENMQVPGAAAAGSLLIDFQKKKLLSTPSTPTR